MNIEYAARKAIAILDNSVPGSPARWHVADLLKTALEEDMAFESQFRAGKPIAPNYVVTAQQDADYLLRELANVTARNKYLQGQVATHRDEAEAALAERDEARDSLRPWQFVAILGWAIALVEFIAKW